jgi:hypothetical protein
MDDVHHTWAGESESDHSVTCSTVLGVAHLRVSIIALDALLLLGAPARSDPLFDQGYLFMINGNMERLPFLHLLTARCLNFGI